LKQNQLAAKLKEEPAFQCDAWILKVNGVNMFATATEKIGNDIIAGVKNYYFKSKANVQSVTLNQTIALVRGKVSTTSLRSVESGVNCLVKKPYVTASIKLNGPDLGNGPLARPMVKLQTSSGYGNRGGARHLGIDFRNPKGTPIYATGNGTVIKAGYSGSFGNLVKIDHGNGLQTWYAHCSTILVPVGTKVSRGQQIATVGATGNASGNHLHYEVRRNGVPQNPWSYM
ncbi:MAG: M23 family metallopeptidase, partial [Anaerovorax sp.]